LPSSKRLIYTRHVGWWAARKAGSENPQSLAPDHPGKSEGVER
jgi:hypothetical protein